MNGNKEREIAWLACVPPIEWYDKILVGAMVWCGAVRYHLIANGMNTLNTYREQLKNPSPELSEFMDKADKHFKPLKELPFTYGEFSRRDNITDFLASHGFKFKDSK